jgi:hypothetical protein
MYAVLSHVFLMARLNFICTLSCAVQFVAGGLQISVVVAIDFTASNGDVLTPGSLHYNRLVSETTETTTFLVSCICTAEYRGR